MKRGIDADGARDADALALAAGELARVAVHQVRRQADAGKQSRDRVAPFGRVAHEPDAHEGLGDDVGDGAARAERAVGILEDDLEVTAQLAHLASSGARRCRGR